MTTLAYEHGLYDVSAPTDITLQRTGLLLYNVRSYYFTLCAAGTDVILSLYIQILIDWIAVLSVGIYGDKKGLLVGYYY